jgi:predicted nicotinamide N-methyase
VGLAGALYDDPPRPGTRVLELGCGLALPSVMAARAGAHVDWATHGDALAAPGPFDLVLAADVLYTKVNVEAALSLFPRLVAPAGELRIADPNRAGAARFLSHFPHHTEPGEDVSLHTVRFDGEPAGHK